jgi:hypothetical protein
MTIGRIATTNATPPTTIKIKITTERNHVTSNEYMAVTTNQTSGIN